MFLERVESKKARVQVGTAIYEGQSGPKKEPHAAALAESKSETEGWQPMKSSVYCNNTPYKGT